MKCRSSTPSRVPLLDQVGRPLAAAITAQFHLWSQLELEALPSAPLGSSRKIRSTSAAGSFHKQARIACERSERAASAAETVAQFVDIAGKYVLALVDKGYVGAYSSTDPMLWVEKMIVLPSSRSCSISRLSRLALWDESENGSSNMRVSDGGAP